MFSPHQQDILATCSTDGTLKLFDLRTPSYQNSGPNTNTFTNPISAAVLTVPASGTEVLSVDWNKYRPFVLASAGVDKSVKVWDCRMIKTNDAPQVGGICETQLLGHEYAVRKVQWSPHRPDVLATASYDMTCRVYVPTFRSSYFIQLTQTVQMDDYPKSWQASIAPYSRSSYRIRSWLRMVALRGGDPCQLWLGW